KHFTMEALVAGLDHDFDGCEPMRQYLLNRVPKWGNGDPESTQLTQRIVDAYCDTIHTFENGRGGAEWVRDVIEISEGYGIHHNYHTFHETMFGLYQNEAHLPPDNRNETLADLFTQLFAE
ncbi:MAG: pyruvate formate lyase family protein, partial [Spirochaetota bacterium]